MHPSRSPMRTLLAASSLAGLALLAGQAQAAGEGRFFTRLATLPVDRNLPAGTDPASATAAEIVTATPDGMTLIYTDGPGKRIGFIDIADPAAPRPAGTLALAGEPTSATVVGSVALVAVNTGESKAKPTGEVAAVDLASRTVKARCDVGGQPDSVAASPDGRFLAVAVENERDEELNEGKLPQLPAGHLAILDLDAGGVPANCDSVRKVDLAGLALVAPEDPEPEFVDVNAANVAALTLQENNHIVLIDLASGKVTGHFPAGTVDLAQVDTNGDMIISATGEKKGIKREPDAIAWLPGDRLATADEGDYEGGSRTFTIFDAKGRVLWSSGNLLEHLGIRHGQYPVKRAKAKGVEPEAVEFGRFGEEPLIFVGAERGNFVAVFADRGGDRAPEFLQLLPTGIAPEGVLAIPARGLLVMASEASSAKDNVRSTITLYRHGAEGPAYPMLVAEDDPATGAPIGWGALSGLAADPATATGLVAVSDGYYGTSRLYAIDAGAMPARITGRVELQQDGKPVAYDLEGIAARAGGGWWAVSEGNPESKNPLTRQSLLLAVKADGTVEEAIPLPEALAAQAGRFGFEGVAATGSGAQEKVVIAVQRPWQDDPKDTTKLAVYTPAKRSWGFVRYPLEAPRSPAGGWVGLSEITALGKDRYALIERDNQPGTDAAFKAITVISLADVEPKAYGEELPMLEKRAVIDLLPPMRAGAGWISDKPEGFAVLGNGRLMAVTDNDGMDNAPGDTQLLDLGTVELLTPTN